MQRRPGRVRISLLSLIVLGLVFAAAVRAGGGNFSVGWWSVDGAGDSGASATFVLSGTAGQADAGSGASANYALHGGFWTGGGELGYALYLPVVVKAPP